MDITLEQFAAMCSYLTGDQIYEMFESHISEDLRDKVYALNTDAECPEPTRASLNALGELYKVKSLIDY